MLRDDRNCKTEEVEFEKIYKLEVTVIPPIEPLPVMIYPIWSLKPKRQNGGQLQSALKCKWVDRY